jgi:hypothetical protein
MVRVPSTPRKENAMANKWMIDPLARRRPGEGFLSREGPTFTTASVPDGPNGPLIPEIHEHNKDAIYIPRTG